MVSGRAFREQHFGHRYEWYRYCEDKERAHRTGKPVRVGRIQWRLLVGAGFRQAAAVDQGAGERDQTGFVEYGDECALDFRHNVRR